MPKAFERLAEHIGSRREQEPPATDFELFDWDAWIAGFEAEEPLPNLYPGPFPCMADEPEFWPDNDRALSAIAHVIVGSPRSHNRVVPRNTVAFHRIDLASGLD